MGGIGSREEEYWRQKSREVWLQQGDKNTKKVHASAQQKWVAKSIFQIMDLESSTILTNSQQIKDEGLKFFENLLAPVEHPSLLPSQVEDFI